MPPLLAEEKEERLERLAAAVDKSKILDQMVDNLIRQREVLVELHGEFLKMSLGEEWDRLVGEMGNLLSQDIDQIVDRIDGAREDLYREINRRDLPTDLEEMDEVAEDEARMDAIESYNAIMMAEADELEEAMKAAGNCMEQLRAMEDAAY